MPIGQRLQGLRLALAIAPELQTEEQIKLVFTPEVINFLCKQLSNQKLSGHTDACRGLNQLINHLKQPADESADAGQSNNDARFAAPSDRARQAANFFTHIGGKCPLFDVTAAPKAPRLLPVR